MDSFLLGMTVLVSLAMIGAMTWMTFDGNRDTSPIYPDEITKLLAQFDELEAMPGPRFQGSTGLRGRGDDAVAADGVHPAGERRLRLL